MFSNFPNILTLSRILLIPFIMGTFYVNNFWSKWVAAFLFVVACLTDFLDGYIARQWSQITKIGSFLDPIADKLLVSSIILCLAGFGQLNKISLIPALIILLREVMVSGLREFVSEIQVNIPVTFLSKWKTAIQMMSLSLLLVEDAIPTCYMFNISFGEVLLWLAAFMTIVSGIQHLRSAFKYLL